MNGISDFPPNFVANNQIDVDSVRNSSAKAVLCNSCNEQLPATARCLDCMEFLCYACHNAHSRVRVTKDHRVSLISLMIVALLKLDFYNGYYNDYKYDFFFVSLFNKISDFFLSRMNIS